MTPRSQGNAENQPTLPNLAAEVNAATREGVERARKERGLDQLAADIGMPAAREFTATGDPALLALPPAKAATPDGKRAPLVNCLECGKVFEAPPAVIGRPLDHMWIPICHECAEDEGDDGMEFIGRIAIFGCRQQWNLSQMRIARLEQHIADRDAEHRSDVAVRTNLLHHLDAAQATEAKLRSTVNHWLEQSRQQSTTIRDLKDQRLGLACLLGVAVVLAVAAFIF